MSGDDHHVADAGIALPGSMTMPFSSEKQRRKLWARRPDVARRFANEEKREKPQRRAGRKGGRRRQQQLTGGYKAKRR